MTKINKIVMHGFKSFAKHTELVFGGDFNCVLGPNGSGKSNILDALCFVLGKSSTKSLRAERASNLIYNGGKSKKPAKQGEVSVYFDNNEKTFPTDDPQVKITRVVRQTGQSIYKINDKVRTRQQIIDLLNVAKIDPNGYNIILQGDIVRFTEMPSIERRMLIEEISGISVYEEKKHKAMLELGKVEQKLNDAELILRERNTYLKELKKDRDQALKYKDMSDKIKQYKASYLKIQIDRQEKQETELKSKIEGLNKELEKINSKVSELKNENKEKKERIEQISHEIEEKGEKGQVELNREIEALKILMARQNSRIETCKNEIEKIKKRKEDLQNEDKEVFEKIKKLNDSKKGYEEEINKLRKQISDFDNKIKEFKEKNKFDKAADLEKEIDRLDKESEELQKEAQGLREEEHNLLRQKDRVEHNLSIIDEKIDKVKEIEKEYKDDIETLRKKRDEFKNITVELNKKLSEDISLSQQIADNRKKITNAIEELAKLEARSAGIKEHIISDLAVKKILGLKKQGVYGTVGDLGEVNSKYALALEVAAGARLKSIVVEDDKVASECIKYLKQKRFGVATFFPLNKIKAKSVKAEVKSIAKAKGSHGLAINLVSFDNKFKKIFEHIFADTVVVDNIDTARRLGIGKAKMVTLDGDIAEISGVMQGGFRQRKKQSYGFKEKEITKNIKEYESSIKELKNVISTLEKRRDELEEKIESLRNKKANLDGEIIKTQKSLHLEAGDIDLSKKQKQDFQKDLEKVNKSISEVDEKIMEKNKELTSFKIKRQELRNQISQLRDPALLAELSAFQEKKREISEDIIKYESEIKNIETQVNMHEQGTGKTSQILKQLDNDGVSFNEEINKINGTLQEKRKILSEKEEKAKDFYAKFKSLFDKRNKISEEIQKNDKVIEDTQLKSRDTEINANTISLKKAEITAKLSALNHEFEQYHGVDIVDKPEEELEKEISKFEEMRDEIGSVNMRALEIYEEVEKEYNKLLEKKDTLLKEKGSVEGMMKEIESKKKDLFMKTYDVITENFKRIFSLLTKKGDAHLELENQENPFEAGLNIKVRIIGNKFLDIRSLSGGEKTLTALAFIFAIQEHEPAKFYVLDEVDAALDKHNSEKFAGLIKKYAEKAQYVIISHNDAVVTEATNLYGISMNEHGISNTVSLKI